MSGNSDYVIRRKHHARQGNAEGKRLSYLMPSRQPKKDGINFIAIKKEKAVTLNPLLPCVYDSYLLTYGCPGSRPHGSIVDLAPFFLPCHSPWPFTCLTTFCKTGYSVNPLTWLLYVNRKEKICFAGSSTAFSS